LPEGDCTLDHFLGTDAPNECPTRDYEVLMRAWPSNSLVRLVGCVLWLVGCSGPVPEVVPVATEDEVEKTVVVQAIHHVRQEVSPVLTWRENPSPTVPMSLTASDGTGLDLVAVKARVVIEDPLAFTELHLTFVNPEDRRREGRFEIDLPPGAALSRLSMKIGDQFQEGEVVERQKAQRTFEDFMHERPDVDPALLEKDAGNKVRARVFPILPHERKEIIVSFSQELGSSPYRLPLQGLSTVEDFDTRVVVKTHDSASAGDRSSLSGMQSAQRVVELQRTHFTPDKDLVIELDGGSPAAGLHAGDLAVVRVRPDADRPATPPASLLVLFDTSASSAAGFNDRVELLGRALSTMAQHQDFRVRVVGFDQTQQSVFEGMASAMRVDVLADLIEGRALGASNLEAALAMVAREQGRWERVLLVSDGVATAGQTDRSALRTAVRELEAVGVRRLDALAPGAGQDRERLGDLTSALPQAGVIVDDARAPEVVAHALSQAPFGDVAISVKGASWSWPESLAGVQPGDDVLVFARYEGARPDAVTVELSDPSLPAQVIETLEVERPLVERAWARARIARIQHQQARLQPGPSPTRAAMDARVIELSTHYRVLTNLTALLVLETEADYRRFRIDRNGKADILSVDGGSVRLTRRSEGERKALRVEDDLQATVVASADDSAAAIPQMARNFDPDAAARDTGALGMVEQESGYFLASPYGAAFAAGNDDEDVWGGLTGTEVGEAFGVGGLGLVGTGYGGGGTGEGTIGLGNHGVIGSGGGGGSGSGYGRGAGAGFGGRGQRVPMVRQAKAQVTGSLDKDIIRRIVRAHINEVRHCYNQGLASDPNLKGRVLVAFTIDATGTVVSAVVDESDTTLRNPLVAACIAKATKRWRFPKPAGGGVVQVKYPFILEPAGESTWSSAPTSHWGGHGPVVRHPRPIKSAHTGRFAETQALLASGQIDAAYDLAWSWVQAQPSDVLALLALGDVLEKRERLALAARVYGSLIDLHPSRADIRRAAGERLERLGEPGLELAIDSYAKAVESRPDHPSGARLHAWALVERGDHERAFDVLVAANERSYPAGRFAGVHALLREDLALVAAGWLAKEVDEGLARARARVEAAGVRPSTEASTRFVVTWETDTTDVDVLLHTAGSGRNHGHRIADVRTGYGPEARVLEGARAPREVQASVRYFDRSSQGHAMGTVQVVSHDGRGHIRLEAHPFVLMQQKGVLQLGSIETHATQPSLATGA
jgi:Vault protein inter-alpha-trypsin domain